MNASQLVASDYWNPLVTRINDQVDVMCIFIYQHHTDVTRSYCLINRNSRPTPSGLKVPRETSKSPEPVPPPFGKMPTKTSRAPG